MSDSATVTSEVELGIGCKWNRSLGRPSKAWIQPNFSAPQGKSTFNCSLRGPFYIYMPDKAINSSTKRARDPREVENPELRQTLHRRELKKNEWKKNTSRPLKELRLPEWLWQGSNLRPSAIFTVVKQTRFHYATQSLLILFIRGNMSDHQPNMILRL